MANDTDEKRYNTLSRQNAALEDSSDVTSPCQVDRHSTYIKTVALLALSLLAVTSTLSRLYTFRAQLQPSSQLSSLDNIAALPEHFAEFYANGSNCDDTIKYLESNRPVTCTPFPGEGVYFNGNDAFELCLYFDADCQIGDPCIEYTGCSDTSAYSFYTIRVV